MAKSRSRDQWRIASSVMAMIANVNRDPKKADPYDPDDFNPHACADAIIPMITADQLFARLQHLQ